MSVTLRKVGGEKKKTDLSEIKEKRSIIDDYNKTYKWGITYTILTIDSLE